MIFPTPLYRFFSKEKYRDDLVDSGVMRFTPVSAFTKLPDEKYKDEGEKYYKVKIVQKDKGIIHGKEVFTGGEISHQYRKIDDAWAFCATSSIVSSARKPFTAYIKDIGKLQFELKKSIKNYFGEQLPIMMGPIAYYDEELDVFSEVIPPPYFCKPEKFKSDLEFRIVIVPSDEIYENKKIEPIDLKIDNSQKIFGKTLLLKK